MKKTIATIAILAGFAFCVAVKPIDIDSAVAAHKTLDSTLNVIHQLKDDSIVAAHKVKDDSLFADLKKHTPDSLKIKIDEMGKSWVLANNIDSIKNVFANKRDSIISVIKKNDTAAAAKIKARIAELESDRIALKVKLDARKAEIEAKIAEMKKNKK